MHPNTCTRHRQQGFTLLEALVTIVVVSIGLLGILGLQTVSLVNTQMSAARGTAAVAAENIAARIAANPKGAEHYENITPGDAIKSESDTDCFDKFCGAKDMADYDARIWEDMLADNLPNGEGYIDCVDDATSGTCRVYEVTIAWDERERAHTDKDESPSKGEDAPDLCEKKRCFVTRIRP